MSPQNFQDDYYSNINSDNAKDSSSDTKKKPVIVKKKIKVKPKQDEAIVNAQNTTENTTQDQEVSYTVKGKEKEFISPISFMTQ